MVSRAISPVNIPYANQLLTSKKENLYVGLELYERVDGRYIELSFVLSNPPPCSNPS